MEKLVRWVVGLAAVATLAGCWPWLYTTPQQVQPQQQAYVQPQGQVATYPAAQPPQQQPGQPVTQSAAPRPVQITLANNSGIELCYLFVSVAGEPWGDDQLGPNTTIPAGAQVVLELDGNVPAWDMMAQDCSHQTFYDVRGVPLPADGVWSVYAMQGMGGGGGSASGGGTTNQGGGGGYAPSVPAEPSGGGSAPAVNRRLAVVAAWYLGASSGDIDDLLRGDCGFISNSDLQDFCRGDCGFIDNSDLQDLCRGDCGFIGNSDLQDFCRGDCGFIDNSDLQDFCRGDCGFIDDGTMANACRAL